MKRILITGSRGWTDERALRDAIHDHATDRQTGEHIAVVIHGACPSGADRMASAYCDYLGLGQEIHPADWDRYGKAAGFRRNAEMAALGGDACLAFWDGKSRGTKHMMEQCEKHGIPVKIFR